MLLIKIDGKRVYDNLEFEEDQVLFRFILFSLILFDLSHFYTFSAKGLIFKILGTYSLHNVIFLAKKNLKHKRFAEEHDWGC